MKFTSLGDAYYEPAEITDEMIEKIAAGPFVTKVKKKQEIKIHSCPSVFDIEASNLKDIKQAVMYVWQWRVDDITIVGRTWEEFTALLDKFNEALGDVKLIVFVHNLSYEFAFLAGVIPFSESDVFATGSHKVLYCNNGAVEFRCSYKLSNMSLKLFTNSFHVKHLKQSGEDFDYSKRRFPWTPLTPEELSYCVNDVVGCQEAIEAIMKRDGDTLATIPLTSTGYVRREVKEALNASGDAKKLQWKSADLIASGLKHTQKKLPDFETYKMLRDAFRGGNTHANRYYATGEEGLSIDDVSSSDRSSSYPDVMINCFFPAGNWFTPSNCDLKECVRLSSRSYAYVCELAIYKPRLKRIYEPIPYIPISKCNTLHFDKEAEADNGRVLSADYLEITVTDIDLKIILDMYKCDKIEVKKIRACKYGRLPEPLREKVREYYTNKTALKGDPENELLYAKSKALLNGTYGMTVQDPCKEQFIYDGEGFERFEPEGAEEYREQSEEMLNKFLREYYENAYENKIKYAFLSYAWGVWVAAWARYRLQEAIDLCRLDEETGASCCVYVDTDSVKYTGTVDFTEYNKTRIEESTANGAFAIDSKGKVHYMGVFEEEPENYGKHFRTMGAKKYVYIGEPVKVSEDWQKWADERGYKTDGLNLHITIAGVSKIGGAIELYNRGGLEEFKEGFVFKDAGGTLSKYNGPEDVKDLWIEEDGHRLKVTPNVYIEETEYTLGVTGEYGMMLANFGELCDDYIRRVRVGI